MSRIERLIRGASGPFGQLAVMAIALAIYMLSGEIEFFLWAIFSGALGMMMLVVDGVSTNNSVPAGAH